MPRYPLTDPTGPHSPQIQKRVWRYFLVCTFIAFTQYSSSAELETVAEDRTTLIESTTEGEQTAADGTCNGNSLDGYRPKLTSVLGGACKDRKKTVIYRPRRDVEEPRDANSVEDKPGSRESDTVILGRKLTVLGDDSYDSTDKAEQQPDQSSLVDKLEENTNSKKTYWQAFKYCGWEASTKWGYELWYCSDQVDAEDGFNAAMGYCERDQERTELWYCTNDLGESPLYEFTSDRTRHRAAVFSWVIYEYCRWEGNPDGDKLRWYCDQDQNTVDGWHDWWYYCEFDLKETRWYCTDQYGPSVDHASSAFQKRHLEAEAIIIDAEATTDATKH